MVIPQFITRANATRDYISEANDQIRLNGNIDVNSPLYQNAIDQYNSSNQKPYLIDISLGCSLFNPTDPETLEYLLMSADNRLYVAKQQKKAQTKK